MQRAALAPLIPATAFAWQLSNSAGCAQGCMQAFWGAKLQAHCQCMLRSGAACVLSSAGGRVRTAISLRQRAFGQADSEKPSRAVHNPVTGGYVSQARAMSTTLIRFARTKSRAAHVTFRAQQTQVSVSHNRTSAACSISSGSRPAALAPIRHGPVNLLQRLTQRQTIGNAFGIL